MITESELRDRLNYDDTHLGTLSGPVLARQVNQRVAHRRIAMTSVTAAAAVLAAGGGFYAWERHPRVIRADIAYASGPTVVLPDGRIDAGMGGARAWVDSENRICFGDDRGSLCTPVEESPSVGRFSMMGTAGTDGLIGGLVHKPLRRASFTTPEGQELQTLVIGFAKFPGWRVVIAVVPRTEAGSLLSPEDLTFTGSN